MVSKKVSELLARSLTWLNGLWLGVATCRPAKAGLRSPVQTANIARHLRLSRPEPIPRQAPAPASAARVPARLMAIPPPVVCPVECRCPCLHQGYSATRTVLRRLAVPRSLGRLAAGLRQAEVFLLVGYGSSLRQSGRFEHPARLSRGPHVRRRAARHCHKARQDTADRTAGIEDNRQPFGCFTTAARVAHDARRFPWVPGRRY